ncbi:CRISPR-associated endonuclease Cas2 [Saccharopolyspora sp. 7B]|uniref:CRISPR-associated endonuclease Cas2 n=1 Tax=Saccharopolyspora sp. 7B TaxID=2877240 RepID=UPI001CD6A0C1|nr:CRISPR-associated endonuclease Cas2 [Saccharopolyspora sp. 7B]MCA1278271.1 CRISPR-associated endonuclease Cas2 [Saccharopolyspora sp. 7B]
MPRHRYLVAYDIRDPTRLRRVAATLERFGERVQYSVFLCDLSGADLADLRFELGRVLDAAQDSVLLVDLGPCDHARAMEVLGTGRAWPVVGPRIV